MKVNKYVENYILPEYANCLPDGYYLDIEELPKHEISNFLDILMNQDSHVRDFILDHMQQLIDQRLPFFERSHKQEFGMNTIVDQNNGEVTWIRGAA